MKKRVLLIVSICLIISDIIWPRDVNVNQAVVPFILGALAVASSAYGAIKSGNENRKNQGLLDSLSDENKADFVREYHRDALENPGSKAYLKRLSSTMEDNNKVTENTAAATGATQENVLAAKQSNNRVMSDAVSGLIEKEDNRQQVVKQGYLQRKQGLVGTQMGLNSQRAQTWADTAQGISSAAGSLASAYMMSDGKLLNPAFAGEKPIDATKIFK